MWCGKNSKRTKFTFAQKRGERGICPEKKIKGCTLLSVYAPGGGYVEYCKTGGGVLRRWTNKKTRWLEKQKPSKERAQGSGENIVDPL